MTTIPPRASWALALATALTAGCASAPPPSASTPASAPAVPPPAATPPAAAAAPAPPPPPSNASEVLSRGRAPFDACYAQARVARPGLGRTSVEITFSFGDDGKLFNVDLAYRNRMDDASKDCMRKAAEGLTFPKALLWGKQTGTIEFSPPGS